MHKISKVLLICIMFILCLTVFIVGCYDNSILFLENSNDKSHNSGHSNSNSNSNSNSSNDSNISSYELNNYQKPEEESLPEEIKNWVNRSLSINLGQSKIYGSWRYILVTYGEKPSGGYYVNIEDVKVLEDKVEVDVRFKEPQKGDMVTQAITYPYDLVVIDAVDLPVKFNVFGDEMHLMTLKGVDLLKPLAAKSSQIKIFEPSPNEVVEEEKFIISGIASVFEGNIVYEIMDEEGNTLYEGYTTAGMGDWYYFELEIETPGDISNKFNVELYSPSAIDGSKTSLVSIPLRLIEE